MAEQNDKFVEVKEKIEQDEYRVDAATLADAVLRRMREQTDARPITTRTRPSLTSSVRRILTRAQRQRYWTARRNPRPSLDPQVPAARPRTFATSPPIARASKKMR